MKMYPKVLMAIRYIFAMGDLFGIFEKKVCGS